jgi:hypothetical protein
MCDIDHVRADVASAALRAVPVPPASTTFAAAAQRFDDNAVTAVEDAMGVLIARWFKVMPARRRDQLSACRPSIDLDGTDSEVYGKQKQGVAYNYAGQKVGRAHPATWAETGLVLAADLGSGVDDPRPQAPGLITRAIANLPAGLPRPRVRADAGYFDAKVAHAAVAAGADFGIAAKRNTATWRAVAAVHEAAWEDCWDHARRPGRRLRLRPGGMAGRDPLRCPARTGRPRRDPQRSAVASAAHDPPRPAGVGPGRRSDRDLRVQLHRHQPDRRAPQHRALVPGTSVDRRTPQDSKLGYGLFHLPSGKVRVNRIWMWSAYLATNLSVFTQNLGHIDVDGRAHSKRARRELFALPARVTRHARRIIVRFAVALPTPRSAPPGNTSEHPTAVPG